MKRPTKTKPPTKTTRKIKAKADRRTPAPPPASKAATDVAAITSLVVNAARERLQKLADLHNNVYISQLNGKQVLAILEAIQGGPIEVYTRSDGRVALRIREGQPRRITPENATLAGRPFTPSNKSSLYTTQAHMTIGELKNSLKKLPDEIEIWFPLQRRDEDEDNEKEG